LSAETTTWLPWREHQHSIIDNQVYADGQNCKTL